MSISLTDAQKEQARAVDMIDLLAASGYQIKRLDYGYYAQKDDAASVFVFNDRKGWKIKDTEQKGRDAIAFLMASGTPFPDAVVTLCNASYPHYSPSAQSVRPAQTNKVSDAAIQRAQSIDMVDYLSAQGYQIMQAGKGYSVKSKQKAHGDLSSLSIFSDRKGWKRWSDGTSGQDTISFLVKVEGMRFQDAVALLSDEKIEYSRAMTIESPIDAVNGVADLVLPPVTEGPYSRLYGYLCQTRGIDSDILTALVKQKLVYQDKRGNAVFVGTDSTGSAKYAALRGTATDVQFRGECQGSNKKFGFRIEASDAATDTICVFESPIDALSHATLAKMRDASTWQSYTRLSLGGTADTALESYLLSHTNIRKINLCLDNDEAGQAAMQLIQQKFAKRGYVVSIHAPQHGKDFNELLCSVLQSAKKGKKTKPAAESPAAGEPAHRPKPKR